MTHTNRCVQAFVVKEKGATSKVPTNEWSFAKKSRDFLVSSWTRIFTSIEYGRLEPFLLHFGGNISEAGSLGSFSCSLCSPMQPFCMWMTSFGSNVRMSPV